MRTILVFNPKGGCGKTTLATNLAARFASAGHATALIDHDAQGSSTGWLALRPADRAPIHGVPAFRNATGMTRSFQTRVPLETRYTIIDTPAGFVGPQFSDLLRRVDRVLIPVLPSLIDIHAAKGFCDDFRLMREIERCGARIGFVANRVRRNTRSTRDLIAALCDLPFPVLSELRDSQHYLRAAEQGLGVHELTGYPVFKDRQQLAPIVEWIDQEAPSETPWARLTPAARHDDTPFAVPC